jgi:hypothetical protein
VDIGETTDTKDTNNTNNTKVDNSDSTDSKELCNFLEVIDKSLDSHQEITLKGSNVQGHTSDSIHKGKQSDACIKRTDGKCVKVKSVGKIPEAKLPKVCHKTEEIRNKRKESKNRDDRDIWRKWKGYYSKHKRAEIKMKDQRYHYKSNQNELERERSKNQRVDRNKCLKELVKIKTYNYQSKVPPSQGTEQSKKTAKEQNHPAKEIIKDLIKTATIEYQIRSPLLDDGTSDSHSDENIMKPKRIKLEKKKYSDIIIKNMPSSSPETGPVPVQVYTRESPLFPRVLPPRAHWDKLVARRRVPHVCRAGGPGSCCPPAGRPGSGRRCRVRMVREGVDTMLDLPQPKCFKEVKKPPAGVLNHEDDGERQEGGSGEEVVEVGPILDSLERLGQLYSIPVQHIVSVMEPDQVTAP